MGRVIFNAPKDVNIKKDLRPVTSKYLKYLKISIGVNVILLIYTLTTLIHG